MRNKEISQKEKIEQLTELIKSTEKNIQLEKSTVMKEYNNNWNDIEKYDTSDDEFRKLMSDLWTPEEIDKNLENGKKAVEEMKIRFEADLYKKMSEEIKNLNALKRKLKRLKTEKPKPKPQNIPEFKVEPLI